MSFCKPKDWDWCRVEKMGCEGCYFNNDNNRYKEMNKTWNKAAHSTTDFCDALILAMQNTGKQFGIKKEIDENKCYVCGNAEPHYCEGCYQKLIENNLKMSIELRDHVSKTYVGSVYDRIMKVLIDDKLEDNYKVNALITLMIVENNKLGGISV